MDAVSGLLIGLAASSSSMNFQNLARASG